LNHAVRMDNDDDFIRDFDNSLPVRGGELTGWESVMFELADEDDGSE
jgi:hypothetical protein